MSLIKEIIALNRKCINISTNIYYYKDVNFKTWVAYELS